MFTEKIKDKKIIVVTPAGRRRYMKYLVPQILSDDTVDKYEIWVNTENENDIKFLKQLSEKYDKIRLINQPEGKINGNLSINAFFTTAIDEDSIYIRLDDDICWIEPDFFNTMKMNRENDLNSFLISPLVINNAICTHLLQQENKYSFNNYLGANCMDKTTWANQVFAYNLHNWFLDLIFNDDYKKIKFDNTKIALNRFSINSICWFGDVMRKFQGIVKGDEEEYLTVLKTRELISYNTFYANTIVAHYAFYPQRNFLDDTDILEKYENAIRHSYRNNQKCINLLDEILNLDNEITIEQNLQKNNFDLKNIMNKIQFINLPIPYIKFISINKIKQKIKMS